MTCNLVSVLVAGSWSDHDGFYNSFGFLFLKGSCQFDHSSTGHLINFTWVDIVMNGPLTTMGGFQTCSTALLMKTKAFSHLSISMMLTKAVWKGLERCHMS